MGISSDRAWLPLPAALLAGLERGEGWSASDMCHFRHLAVLVRSSSSLLLKTHISTPVFSTQVCIWFLLLQPLTFHEKVIPCTLFSGKAFQPPGKQPPLPSSLCLKTFAALSCFPFYLTLLFVLYHIKDQTTQNYFIVKPSRFLKDFFFYSGNSLHAVLTTQSWLCTFASINKTPIWI